MSLTEEEIKETAATYSSPRAIDSVNWVGFALAIEAKVRAEMAPKFKVGDRVRFASEPSAIGTVREMSVYVEWDDALGAGDNTEHDERELELAQEVE